MSKINKSRETKRRLVVARGWGKGGKKMTANGNKISFGVMKYSKIKQQ